MNEEHRESHLDPTAEISLDTVKQRSVKGVVALTGRYFVLYAITLGAQGILGALLTTAQFGVFGIVSAIINFLVYFSDIGLAAALIQKKEKVDEDDLKTTFTVQQILVLTLLTLIFVFSSKIQRFYNLDQSSIYLLYALGISFFMSSLKTIPSVLLERGLNFEKIAISNILESIAYNICLVFLAWKGFGITSFTIAVLVRGVVGLFSLYIFQPWKPSFTISRKSLSKLLKFGIPYQINTFIAVLKDDGLTLVLGKIIGIGPLGILVWAQKWIQVPLRVVLDNVTKVTFPAFSRMQDDKESLEKAVTKSVFFTTVLVFPATVAILILFPIVTNMIPKYNQWLPAIFPLTLLSINVLFAAVTTQLTNLLNAIGKIKITSGLMVMWTVLTWVFVPILAKKYGADGAAAGYALVGMSSIIAIFIVKKYVNFSLTEAALKPFFASVVMGITLLVLRSMLPATPATLGVLIVTGAVLYTLCILALVGVSLIEDAKKTFSVLLKK
ncbi:MAG: polysaccharide biosynthesis protein [Microgenomates group bacterium GW2011_GWC1_41_20]|uniref:Polysaccharide biosynthesis protein n=6 Tax=Candidatus Woeseibacteriota TaxID=1752722 RepID=A0A0G0RRR1_9BACT|nr:MAG: Polysaccharide biosynthesis protein [Candidatus Woesebacteria bacterium GW2011_GWB1_40_12]KKR55203.1 MAG: Polysaccharide biosynthesis protein [Candidatus Woesebacteria bacterium GW2011_GWF1_40_24]KKR90856.1 MAG: Polysaccharide biosynthesis protein [Candidatus Woesebacteria bacterium GW2011_GWD1_41_12]KKS00249.1 MAG: polysaccharide biosynthesis protein [Microgenomates group bacterium GW2011_GWC1_41_20]KKS03754.1 MAG: Polysaccharide biosynthesis protein [Candidatus Woesebacteria bacterium